MYNNLTITTKRDIRIAKWYEEIAEYFCLDKVLLEAAVAPKRLDPENELSELKEARESIRKKYMSMKAMQIHDKILKELPENVTDYEKSSSWREYIFVNINGERRSFQRMNFYDRIISCIVKPMLERKDNIVVLDYGCGSSLFTRMLSQDFKGDVSTISADVCILAVNFSIARNKLYNPNSSGILIEDVSSFPELKGIDLILAYTVFEHLPNSTYQIQSLINSLSPGGVLIENYTGHSSGIPHKSDTFDSYRSRDVNLDLLNKRLTLLCGTMPKKENGIYEMNSDNRFWTNGDTNSDLNLKIRRRLHKENSLIRKSIKRLRRLIFK